MSDWNSPPPKRGPEEWFAAFIVAVVIIGFIAGFVVAII